MATLTREVPDAAPPRDTRTRAERLRAKTAKAADGEYRIGDRLRSRVNPEIEWTVGGFVENGLTIISPSSKRFNVDIATASERFDLIKPEPLTHTPAPELPAPVVETDPEPIIETLSARPGVRVSKIECSVSRKLSRDYQSTEYRTGVTLDVDAGCDVAQITADTFEELRNIIRREFAATQKKKGEQENGSTG